MQVGTASRIGKAYVGHFDVLLKNTVAHLTDVTQSVFNQKADLGRGTWVNGNDFVKAEIIFGVLPHNETTRLQYNWQPHDPNLVKARQLHHDKLARQQQTRYAVLPIHTQAERDLFQLFSQTSPLFTNQATPQWVALAGSWAEHCDGKSIFYKVCFAVFTEC